MNNIKGWCTLSAALTALLAVAGCSGQAGSSVGPEGTAQSQSEQLMVYWTSYEGGHVLVNQQPATRAEIDAILAARSAAKPNVGTATASSEHLGNSQQAITTGSTSWSICSDYATFLVTSGSNGSGSIFCGSYQDPFSTTGIPMPFVPQWFDLSDAAMFSLCTSASNCFAGDGACSFTTNWITVPAGFDNNVGNNINPPPTVLFINGQREPLVC
jgi:hypothetical protein